MSTTTEFILLTFIWCLCTRVHKHIHTLRMAESLHISTLQFFNGYTGTINSWKFFFIEIYEHGFQKIKEYRKSYNDKKINSHLFLTLDLFPRGKYIFLKKYYCNSHIPSPKFSSYQKYIILLIYSPSLPYPVSAELYLEVKSRHNVISSLYTSVHTRK